MYVSYIKSKKKVQIFKHTQKEAEDSIIKINKIFDLETTPFKMSFHPTQIHMLHIINSSVHNSSVIYFTNTINIIKFSQH